MMLDDQSGVKVVMRHDGLEIGYLALGHSLSSILGAI
jgi:hypothetical protein